MLCKTNHKTFLVIVFILKFIFLSSQSFTVAFAICIFSKYIERMFLNRALHWLSKSRVNVHKYSFQRENDINIEIFTLPLFSILISLQLVMIVISS